MKEKSFILDREIAKKAIEIVEPSILAAMESGIVKRKALSICILNPQGEGIILLQHSINIGEAKEWKHPFDKIAMSKATTAQGKRKNTSYVRDLEPQMLVQGNTIYSGGAYFQGIAVGVSGVEEYFDEMIAKWIVHTTRALCLERFIKVKEAIEEKGEYSIPFPYNEEERKKYIE